MTYDSSRQALNELGRDAKFEDDIGHYNYRRWTANEVNCMSSRVEDGSAKRKNLKLYLT
jgi:hypothetical protein